MIFGLRLEPSITEFGFRMTNLLQIEFFHLNYGKNLIKNLGKIKKLKIKILTCPVNFFEGPSDLGHDHSLF